VLFRSHLVDKGRGDPWREIETEGSGTLWVGVALGDHTLAVQELAPGAEEVLLTVSTARLRTGLGALQVRVVDDLNSRPLQHAEISLGPRRGSSRSEHDPETDSSGNARFEGLTPGEVEFQVDLRGYVSTSRRVAVAALECSTIEVRLETAVTISGVVSDEQGKPLSRTMRAIPAFQVRSEWGWDFYDAPPAEDGSFILEGLSHREYVLLDAGSFAANNSNAPRYTRSSLPKYATFVDARKSDSITGVSLVLSGRDDPAPGASDRR
jgi:hypothetical protein